MAAFKVISYLAYKKIIFGSKVIVLLDKLERNSVKKVSEKVSFKELKAPNIYEIVIKNTNKLASYYF